MWLVLSALVVNDVLPVLPEQMDWGDNQNHSYTTQGRENIKLMVAMVSDSINLECQVAFGPCHCTSPTTINTTMAGTSAVFMDGGEI